jgi:hypothetical protein
MLEASSSLADGPPLRIGAEDALTGVSPLLGVLSPHRRLVRTRSSITGRNDGSFVVSTALARRARSWNSRFTTWAGDRLSADCVRPLHRSPALLRFHCSLQVNLF